MTDGQRQIALAYLNQHPQASCPTCDFREFEVADLVRMERWSRGAPAGDAYPMVLVVCQQCFHCSFFAAVPMGIMVEEE